MTNATTIPADIQEYAGLLGALEGRTGDDYLERYYLDMRANVAMRGGVEAIQAEIEAQSLVATEQSTSTGTELPE